MNYVKGETEATKHAVSIIYENLSYTRNEILIRHRNKLLIRLMWVTGTRISNILLLEYIFQFQNRIVNFVVQKRHTTETPGGTFWLEISMDMETMSEVMDYVLRWSIRGNTIMV